MAQCSTWGTPLAFLLCTFIICTIAFEVENPVESNGLSSVHQTAWNIAQLVSNRNDKETESSNMLWGWEKHRNIEPSPTDREIYGLAEYPKCLAGKLAHPALLERSRP